MTVSEDVLDVRSDYRVSDADIVGGAASAEEAAVHVIPDGHDREG